MARKGETSTAVVDDDSGLTTYRADNGNELIMAPNGTVFTSRQEALDYMEQNRVEILVGEFMADVEADPVKYFGGKSGEIPAKDRALQALKTRLRNAATQVLTWYLNGN